MGDSNQIAAPFLFANTTRESEQSLFTLCPFVAQVPARCQQKHKQRVRVVHLLRGAHFVSQSLWRAMGSIISTEVRAFSNTHGIRVHANSPSGWGPNVNNMRDPRWGRNVEVPGEDPTHAGVYATEYTIGVQGESDTHEQSGGYTKVIAALKHYTAYSVETGRGSTNFWISQHDMEETYLPPYRMAIEKANNLGIMCSYASVNGVPSKSHSSHCAHSSPPGPPSFLLYQFPLCSIRTSHKQVEYGLVAV